MSFFPSSVNNFIHAAMPGDQGYAAGAIDFDTNQGSLGITVDAAGKFTLPAGKIYRLEAGVRFTSSTVDSLSFQWYNVTDAALIGQEGRANTSSSTTSDTTTQPVVSAIIDATAGAKDVECRMSGGSGNETITAIRSYAYIRSLS